jgi:hypothetical protein
MKKYPPEDAVKRINNYEYYEKLFSGDHFDAFNIKTGNNPLMKEFERLRYIVCDYPGMISSLAADMLFEEFPKITTENGDQDDFMNALLRKNNLKAQIYESALENSFRGDAVLRIRSENKEVLIEDLNPSIYFPEYDKANVRQKPVAHNLAWELEKKENMEHKFIFVERHEKGLVKNLFYKKFENGDLEEADLAIYNEIYRKGLEPLSSEIKTNIDGFLVEHIKNYGTNLSYFGISDYKKLTTLFYAINNRITKVDNILDNHGDPILAVPEGVIDEEGKVKKEAMGLVEVPTDEDSGMKPEYIVWDAKLESAFSQIDKIIDMIFMFSETSSSLFGKDQTGARAESGRALKYRLLRTLAKKHRKQLYYDNGLKNLFFNAQQFAYFNKLTCRDVKVKRKPKDVMIEWEDGIINDQLEQLEAEQIKLDNKLTSTAESIMRVENITREEAEQKLKEIEEEKKRNMPDFSTAPQVPIDQFNNKNGN